MKKFILTILPLLLSHIIVAQHSSNAYRKLADSLFQAHNYSTAATFYEKAIRNAPRPGDVMLQIAKCNQKMNRIGDADKWYHEAKNNSANFTSLDSYNFVYILMELQKRKEAESVLNKLISEKPGDLYAKRILHNLLTIEEYYKDSLAYNIAPLSINTPLAEFAPAYYKEGLVFSSAQPQSSTREKSPWDNSEFLNLYQSTKTPDKQFQKPVVLEEKLDSRYHDGPAVFYSGYDKMIVNRNHAAHAEGKKNTWIWHPSLYDAHYSTESKSWQLTTLPFDQPPYSTAHPFMAEDGNTLYFASDRPGGYGGSDIYRATKVNGVWGKPFNVGPVINSPGNEVFPFLSDNILYFASNGQGGLGGLDIFKSPLGASGFAPPVNVGYPINSTADDFSLITKGSGENGYFASSRNGNDDLFEFHKKAEMVKMLAYIYDGKTKQPISNAEAKLMSSTDEDRALTSDKDGYIHFELSRETAYILIGSHEGKSGMINGFALAEEDHQHVVHQIPLFSDSAKIACVAKIQNANGEMVEASTITIFDETTGKIIQEDKNKSIVDFRGEKGHSYRVEIRNKNGDVTTQQVTIAPDETEPKTWSMVLKDATVMIEMAARIFNAENNQPLGGASVKVSTFLEEDIDLVANENGIVEFSLKQGTAYLLVASKDSLNGIYPGEAELTTSKAAITHPVPTYGKPANPLSVAALITDDKGQPISNMAVTVIDKATGQKIPVKVTNGLISFLGERGKEYDIQVSAEGFKPVATSFTIPPDANKVDEISIVLSKHSPSGEPLPMTAHVFKQDDNLPLAEAAVTVISFEADMELKADQDGNVAFTLPEGTAYLMMASRDSYSGMYSGIAEKRTDKSTTALKVATTRLNDNQVTVAGKLRNTQGMMLDEVTVMVTDKTTGEKIPAQFKNGLLGFVGIKGHTYTVSVEDKNHRIQTQDVSIPADAGAQENIDLVFDDVIPAKSKEQSVAVTGNLKKADGTMLDEVVVSVFDKTTGKKVPAQFKNGLLTFPAIKGNIYTVSVEDSNHNIQSQTITIPADAGDEENIDIVFGDQQNANKNPGEPGKKYNIHPPSGEALSMTAHVFKQDDNQPLAGAAVTVISFEADMELKADKDGNVTFTLPEGTAYLMMANGDSYRGMYSGIAEKRTDKSTTVLKVATTRLNDNQVTVAGKLRNTQGMMLDEVTVMVTDKTTGERIPAQFKNGLLTFLAIKGNIYSVSVEDNNHQVQSQDVAIADNAGPDENIDLIFDNKGDAATDQVQRLVPVNKRIKTAEGKMLDEVTVTVFDKATGERVYSQFENGLLKFAGISGNIYAVSIEDKNHNIQSQDIAIPADATGEQNADLILGGPDNTMANGDEDKRIPVVGEIMVAQGNMLDEVEVTVSDKATGERIPSQFKNGLLSFIGVKGNIYSVAVQQGNQPARIEEVVIQENAVNAQRVSIPFDDATNTLANTDATTTLGSNDQQVAVTGRLSDEEGMIPGENTVSVINKETGATVPSEFKNGVLDFTAEKGNVYRVTTEDKNHQVRSQDVTIPNDASTSHEISLAMNESPATIPMSLNVFKSDDKTPLAGANVTITTFDGKQIETTSDENGNVTLSLPENSPYTVFVSKDGYNGMQSGIVQNGSEDSMQSLQISTQKRESDVVPVAALLTGIDENALREQDIVVTSRSTGEVIPAQLNDGILNFYGKQGETYSITVAGGNESLESKEITIPGNATEAHSTIALSGKGNSIGILSEGSNAVASTLIRLNNDGAGDKFYISTGNGNAEITERNGMLYLNDGTGERNLGEGTLARLQNDPSYLKQLGLSFDEIIDIQNIYFDYNKATLDDTDKKELDKAKVVLQRHPHLQLTISAHADDRGTDKYNLNLSKRRAKAVASYLKKIGVNKGGISIEAHGESIPAIPCAPEDCNDEQRQKNRRAEFTLRSSGQVVAIRHTVKSKTKTVTHPKVSSSNLEETLAKYGDKTAEGLSFKISIGAYRFNHTLTFDRLKDLGKVEKVHIDGVTYYYLSSFATMRSAETVKKEVIKRRVKDAFVSIFRDNEKITFKEFLVLIGEGSPIITEATTGNR